MEEMISIVDILMSENTINKRTLNIKSMENPQEEFCRSIESLVATSEYTYLDAIIEHCRVSNIDIDVVPKLLLPDMKRKIKLDAIRLNLLDRGKSKTPKLAI